MLIDRNDYVGLVCRHTRVSGFKIALVVGYPSRASGGGKVRVCFWRAASVRWTLPTLVDVDDLTMLVEADHEKRGSVIRRAAQTALDLKLVPRVWS